MGWYKLPRGAKSGLKTDKIAFARQNVCTNGRIGQENARPPCPCLYIRAKIVIFANEMGKITDYIRERIGRRVLVDNRFSGYYNNFCEGRLPFADVLFRNICEILTDLCNDVTFTNATTADAQGNAKGLLFAQFNRFFMTWGKVVLNRLYIDGFVVIGYDDAFGFRILKQNEFRIIGQGDAQVVESIDPALSLYVMRSASFIEEGKSDKQLLRPFLEFLDNVLNSSNTISARLGTLLIAYPKNGVQMAVLTEEQKKKLEKETAEDYGSLRNQRQMLIFPREMGLEVVNLAGVDQRTTDKAKFAILSIVDRVKIPANQVSIIDASTYKSFANGSELREGDFSKYQSFERLLNQTFVTFAQELGLKVNYTIYNKPTRETAAL